MAGDVPSCWQLMPLEQAMSALIDYRGKTPKKTAVGIPLITAKIVKGGRILPTSEYIAAEDYDAWMRRGLPRNGDIVMTTEAPLGEIAQLDGRKIALAQRLITLRGKTDVLDNTFLKFAMQSSFVQHQLRARATGTTVMGIKQRELRKISLPIPPLPEQRAIAHILGSLDDKIELNRRMNRTLEQMAAAIFKAWFVDFEPVKAKAAGAARFPTMPQPVFEAVPAEFTDSALGPIPMGWKTSTVGDELDVCGGGTPSTKNPAFWDGGVHHFATPKDLSRLSSPILLDTERKVTDAGLAKISSGLLPAGTLLLSSRAPIGYLAVAKVPVGVNQGFIAMGCKRRLNTPFMLNWCQHFMDDIKSRANGTTFLEVSKRNFRPMPINVPPQSLMTAFADAVGPLYDCLTLNLRESETLTAIRDALLPKLLSGEIRVGAAEKMVEEVA